MKLNHTVFNYGFVTLTLGIIFYLIAGGNVDQNSVVGMFGGISFNVAIFLAVVFGLQHFQLGTDRDIQKEIYDEKNMAAAIYQAGLWIGLGLVIAKGIM
jgi:uncharacterized membrane protein YjfL (UPF0719 family)